MCRNLNRVPIGLILFGILAGGCATVDGRQQREISVSFESNVPHVEVICSGKSVKTPGSLLLRQSQNHICTAQLAGYDDEVFEIRSGLSKEGFQNSTKLNKEKWGIWTLGVGILMGWCIDLPSGAMRSLKQSEVHLTMKSKTKGLKARAQKILDRTGQLSETLVSVPKEVVDNTTATVLDATVRKSAEQLGLTEPAKEESKTQEPASNVSTAGAPPPAKAAMPETAPAADKEKAGASGSAQSPS